MMIYIDWRWCCTAWWTLTVVTLSLVFAIMNIQFKAFEHVWRTESLTALTMEIIFFWDMTPCGSYKNRRFGGSYRHPTSRCLYKSLQLSFVTCSHSRTRRRSPTRPPAPADLKSATRRHLPEGDNHQYGYMFAEVWEDCLANLYQTARRRTLYSLNVFVTKFMTECSKIRYHV
jgi:hypothetical protein